MSIKESESPTHDTRNLVITGLMGSGKTTVGQLVANSMQREFIDTDQYIETHFGPTKNILSQYNGMHCLNKQKRP